MNITEHSNEDILILKFPVFTYSILIIFTTDIQQSRTKRNEYLGALIDPLSPYVDGLHCYVNNEPDGFIFLNYTTSPGIIAHEVYHAISSMLRYIGATLEEEVVAYHLNYIIDEILKFKKERKITNKPTKKICKN